MSASALIIETLSAVLQDASVASGFGVKNYHNQTTLYPLGFIFLLLSIVGTFSLPRRQALWPCIVLTSIVPTAQRVIVLGLDFSFVRILVFVGLFRILMNGEHRSVRLNRLDKVVCSWIVLGLMIYTLRRGSADALIYKLGMLVDSLGIYGLVRIWIRNWKDVERLSSLIVVLAILSGGLFLYENLTTRNLFSFVGGTNEFTMIRNGELRCQGPFKHPILAGCYWAALLPWIVMRWWARPQSRGLTLLGVGATLLIVMASSSSTPIMGLAGLLMAVLLYPVRRKMHLVRWATVFVLVGLHLVMTMPVWHLITRISVISGSTGYHRYRLIDQAIKRWSEWFLTGTESTAHWGYYLFDVTNQFIKEGVEGGIWTLGLFVWSVWLAFSYVGRLWRSQGRRRGESIRAWGLGVALWSQCVMFMGVSITWSQQNLFTWLLLLATCSSLFQLDQQLRRRASRGPLAASPEKE